MNGGHPLDGKTGLWEDVVADMEATAAEYREAGWEVYELHPGDVVPLPAGRFQGAADSSDDRVGLLAVVPGDEFAEIEPLVEEGNFDGYEAYRAESGGVVFLLVAMRDEAAERAVLLPCYYSVAGASEMLARVEERGEMRTWVRPLDDSKQVVFRQDDPAALLPPDDGEA